VVLAVSTDAWTDIRYREEQRRAGLVFLADPEGHVIADYGLSDHTLGRAVARPATFVLDEAGVVRWRHLPSDWRRRLSATDYLRVFDALDRDLPVPPLDETDVRSDP
jgi:peroxiredoxin